MNALDLLNEAAALAGYVIDSSAQGVQNKARALRRLNIVRTDIISRYGGRWPAQYREGWLALYPIAPCLSTFTNGSYTVPTASDGSTSSATIFASGVPSYMVGAKILAPDGAYYRIAAVDTTNVYLDTPFQGVTQASNSTFIWNDEYTVMPDAHCIGGFTNYTLIATMREGLPVNFADSFPKQTSVGESDVYEVIGTNPLTASYSTGTVSGSVNSNVLTGSGTSWKANLQPGHEILIGTTRYNIRTVDSDTQVTLYQMLTQAIVSGTSYSVVGKNLIKVRFRYPSNQSVVKYWYYSKAYRLVNDNDEDWISELYPRVVTGGMSYFDYIDKNDVIRGRTSQETYEDAIKNMRVAQDNSFTGVRTLGLYIPSDARE